MLRRRDLADGPREGLSDGLDEVFGDLAEDLLDLGEDAIDLDEVRIESFAKMSSELRSSPMRTLACGGLIHPEYFAGGFVRLIPKVPYLMEPRERTTQDTAGSSRPDMSRKLRIRGNRLLFARRVSLVVTAGASPMLVPTPITRPTRSSSDLTRISIPQGPHAVHTSPRVRATATRLAPRVTQ